MFCVQAASTSEVLGLGVLVNEVVILYETGISDYCM